MNIHPIRTENDYKAALRDLSVYFNNEPEPGTDDGYRFEILATLVEAYEAKNFPIEAPDPIEASGEYLLLMAMHYSQQKNVLELTDYPTRLDATR